MSRSNRINRNLVNRIVAQYQEAEFWKSYSDTELSAIFTDAEVTEIKTLIVDMKAADDDNVKKAKLVERSATLVSKILQVAKIVV